MTNSEPTRDPLPLRQGGSIPGLAGQPAYSLSGPAPSPIPILIAVPHAGRAYPPSLIELLRDPALAALRLEDRYVDLLGRQVAQRTGAALLIAHAPRAMIDLNRSTEDIDWEMIRRGGETAGQGSDPVNKQVGDRPEQGHRARAGLGLIPRRLPGVGELWKQPLAEADLRQRLREVHEPYHAALASELTVLRERWGAALLIDLHSMPPLTLRGAQPAAEIVIGDRFGASCRGSLAADAFGYFAGAGRAVAHNRPYAGGYTLDRHGAPRQGHHALQLEIDRSNYLDRRLSEPGPGLSRMVEILCGLVDRLASAVAAIGREDNATYWRDAAE